VFVVLGGQAALNVLPMNEVQEARAAWCGNCLRPERAGGGELVDALAGYVQEPGRFSYGDRVSEREDGCVPPARRYAGAYRLMVFQSVDV